MCCCVFFCCKQKTANEMRIGDWSSDVCSSDLVHSVHARDLRSWLDEWDVRGASPSAAAVELFHAAPGCERSALAFSQSRRWEQLDLDAAGGCIRDVELGRASCRESVCQSV